MRRLVTVGLMAAAMLLSLLGVPASAAEWRISLYTKDKTVCYGFQCGQIWNHLRVPATARKNNGQPYNISSISARARVWKHDFGVLYHDATQRLTNSSDAVSKWTPSGSSAGQYEQRVNVRYDGAFSHNGYYSWFPTGRGCLGVQGAWQPGVDCRGQTWRSLMTDPLASSVEDAAEAPPSGEEGLLVDDGELLPCNVILDPLINGIDVRCSIDGAEVLNWVDSVLPGVDPNIGPVDPFYDG